MRVSSGDGGAEARAVIFDERFDASTLYLLRGQVAACAADVGLSEDRVMDVMLAVHELAANAVGHGAGTGRLLMRAAAGVLRCQVSDAGPGTGTWPVQEGHGLWIVRQVANEVSASSGPDGSDVTAVFRSRRPGHPGGETGDEVRGRTARSGDCRRTGVWLTRG